MSRIRTAWALAFGFLFIAGCGGGDAIAEAGKRRLPRPEPFVLHQWVSQNGDWQHPSDLIGDCDVATYQIWISQDGDVSAGSSWSTGEVPGAWGATDIVLVDGVASQVSMTGGLDQSAISISRMDVTDNFKGDLGVPGTPLKFAGVSNPITMRGSGTLHYAPAGGDYIFVDSPNHLNAVSIPAGIILGLYVREGRVDVGASATFAGTLVTFGPYATVYLAGSNAGYAPNKLQCFDGLIDAGRRGPALADGRIEVGGGRLKLHRLTGTNNYEYVIQTGGVIDFDILEADGAAVIMQLIGGTADFRKCQYVFGTLTSWSYIGPGMQIIPGPATTEAVLTASGIFDFRKEYP